MLGRLAPLPKYAATAALVIGAALAAPAGADAPAVAPSSPVIAESSRARITLDDYEAEMAKVPASLRADVAASRNRVVQLLNNLFVSRALAIEARAAGLDSDPLIARQIELQTEKVLSQARIQKLDRDTGTAFDANPEKYMPRAREIYLTQPERFRIPERVRVSHVLVKVGADGEVTAKGRAEALRSKAAAGADFADLARDASDDPSAKTNGGDLGFVAAKDLDPDFAAAAFTLSTPGELSPVTKSSFGYHVILFHERQPAHQKPFDDVRQDLLSEIRQALIESTRNAYLGAIFTDPKPKVNEALIDKIYLDARGLVTTVQVPPSAPR